MRRRISFSAALLVLLLPGCEPAPDAADWEQMSDRAEAEAMERSLEQNSGTMTLDPVCEECQIFTRTVATLGDRSDPASVGPIAEVAADSALRTFYVHSSTFGGQILVYGKDGRLIRTQGQPGEGPGEFGGQLMLDVGRGDSLHVLQTRPPRYTVWTPAGELARTVPIERRFQDFEVLPSGDLILNAPEPTPRGDTYRLVRLSPTGETLQVFDPTTEDDTGVYFRRIGVAGDWIWAASLARWEVDAFDAEGRHRAHMTADPEWEAQAGFRPGLRPEPGTPIPGQTAGITGPSSGRVYLLTALPAEGARFGDTQGPPYIRTLVQYFYLGRMQVYAAGELQGIVVPMDRGHAQRVIHGADGSTRVEVLSLGYRR